MITLQAFINKVGRENLRKKVGVSDSAISNNIKLEKFPAYWRDDCEELAEAEGIECPRHLFRSNRRKPSKAGGA